MTPLEMVKEFQCAGCVIGGDTDCGKYTPYQDGTAGCMAHIMGTTTPTKNGIVSFALGLPKGFNRGGRCWSDKHRWHSAMYIRLFPKGDTLPVYDFLNVPVWAMERDGFLFVRTAMPRMGEFAVDVIEDGKRADICPQAFDLSKEYENID